MSHLSLVFAQCVLRLSVADDTFQYSAITSTFRIRIATEVFLESATASNPEDNVDAATLFMSKRYVRNASDGNITESHKISR